MPWYAPSCRICTPAINVRCFVSPSILASFTFTTRPLGSLKKVTGPLPTPCAPISIREPVVGVLCTYNMVYVCGEQVPMPADSGAEAAHQVLLRLYTFLLADELVPPLPGMAPAKLRDPPARYRSTLLSYCLFGLPPNSTQRKLQRRSLIAIIEYITPTQ